jgi:hypothetical protein
MFLEAATNSTSTSTSSSGSSIIPNSAIQWLENWFISWIGKLPHIPIPEWAASILVALLIGLFFGVLLKKGITLIIFGVIIVVIILITGLAIPKVFSQLLGFGISGLETIINDFSILIPIEGLFFFVGIALGFWKG